MTPEASIVVHFGEEVKIVLVKDSTAKMGKHGGEKMSHHHKKNRAKFLRLTQSEEKKNDAAYMKSVDKFINDYDGPS